MMMMMMMMLMMLLMMIMPHLSVGEAEVKARQAGTASLPQRGKQAQELCQVKANYDQPYSSADGRSLYTAPSHTRAGGYPYHIANMTSIFNPDPPP
jgi:hypothetical protein